MRSISGIWKSSFLFAVVAAAILAFSVPAFAAPDINRVAFEGNSKVKTDTLQEQVRSRARTPFNPQLAETDVARLMEVYRRSGRAAAKVSYRTVDLPNGRVDLVFTVVEGDKTGVKEIRFIGNEVYSTRRLVGMMETTEMNFLSFLKTSDVYDPDRIAADFELIRRFYLKNGYADFRVISSDVQFDPTAGGYIITITVNEGPQYRVSSVSVESHLPDVDGAALNDLLRLAPGDIYNGDAVEKTVEVLTREISKKGYAFTQARPRGTRNPADQTVAIQFLLEEGPRVYIERINIRGNTRTRDYVIRREFDIGEGDAYNRVLIDRAERRLNGLGYFKKVKVTNEPGSAPDRVILNVDVEDQPTGNFGVSGGYSTNQGFVSEVSVSESNFMGRGQAVRLSVQAGQIARGVTFSFTEPYFLDQRIAAGFDVFARRQDAYNYSIYSSTSIGGTVRLGIPITDELSFSPHYSVYQTTISIPNDKNRPYNDCLVPVLGYTPGFSPFYPDAEPLPKLSVEWRSLARDQRIAGDAGHIACRLCAELQHDRQLQESAQRLAGDAQSGRGRSRRRRAIYSHERRHPLLPRDALSRRRGRHRPSAGRRSVDLRQLQGAHSGQFQSRPEPGARLRAGRHRSARFEYLDELQQQPRQFSRRLKLYRRFARSSVPDLGPAKGFGIEGGAFCRRGFAVEFPWPDELRQQFAHDTDLSAGSAWHMYRRLHCDGRLRSRQLPDADLEQVRPAFLGRRLGAVEFADGADPLRLCGRDLESLWRHHPELPLQRRHQLLMIGEGRRANRARRTAESLASASARDIAL